MSNLKRFDKGDLVRCNGEFQNKLGELIDPAAVFFKAESPSGVEVTYQYGANLELVKDAVGQYHVDVPVNESGVWSYRFYSTGLMQSAVERRFIVERSAF